MARRRMSRESSERLFQAVSADNKERWARKQNIGKEGFSKKGFPLTPGQVAAQAKLQDASERREQARRIKNQSGSAIYPKNAPVITPDGGRLVDMSKGGRGTGGDLTVGEAPNKWTRSDRSDTSIGPRKFDAIRGKVTDSPAVLARAEQLRTGKGLKGMDSYGLKPELALQRARSEASSGKFVASLKKEMAKPGVREAVRAKIEADARDRLARQSYESGLGSGSRRDLSLEEEAAAKGTKFSGDKRFDAIGGGGGKGKGRGNWGHKGRPGKRGGSA